MERELTQICAYLTPRVKETVAYYRGKGVRIEEIRLRREGMLCFTAEGKTIRIEAELCTLMPVILFLK